MNPKLIQLAGAGRAYQSVTQSAAIAVQDGVDFMRNISTIATTALGVGMAQVAATQGKQGVPVITQAQQLIPPAVQAFTSISQAAIQVAMEFPKSFG